ncbi:MAG TPA: hypothetical protein VK179_20675 [Bacteroidales bacterium]|nr:hypothetical protein [Bacteroidales bacterium]
MKDDEIGKIIRQLDAERQQLRIKAINELGEIGDELCLKELRERLKILTLEHKALVIAVAKLKKKLGIV